MNQTATQAQPPGAGPATRLGSFEVGPRVSDSRSTSENSATLDVRGVTCGPFPGTRAFASCVMRPATMAQFSESDQETLERLRSLSGPAIVPILETGITGRIAYVIEQQINGERLAAKLERAGKLQPWLVANVLEDVAAALEHAKLLKLHHGAISPFSIWIDANDRCMLSGFGLTGLDEDHDLEQLAALVCELLSGRPLSIPAGFVINADRIRDHVSGLTESIAVTIARGFARATESKFGSVAEFALSFRSAVTSSVADLVAGAWESISRDDLALAGVLVNMAASYDPECRDLPLLRIRLNQSTMSNPVGVAEQLLDAAAPRPSMSSAAFQRDGRIAEQPAGAEAIYLDQDIEQLLGGNVVSTPKSQLNYWVLFAAGVFAMIVIMVVLVALTLTKTPLPWSSHFPLIPRSGLDHLSR